MLQLFLPLLLLLHSLLPLSLTVLLILLTPLFPGDFFATLPLVSTLPLYPISLHIVLLFFSLFQLVCSRLLVYSHSLLNSLPCHYMQPCWYFMPSVVPFLLALMPFLLSHSILPFVLYPLPSCIVTALSPSCILYKPPFRSLKA